MPNPALETQPSRVTTPILRPGLIIAALAAGGVLVSLAQTLIIPLITELPRIFATSAANASWIITATLVAGAVSTPITGRLADMYGKRRMLLIALAFFIIGSALSATASGVGMMIAGRALQGVASGLIPLGISLIYDLLPRESAGRAIALMSASMGIGGSLGLPLAAAVAQYANWRWLFATVAILAVGIMIALLRIIPKDPPVTGRASFDFIGAIGLATGLIALLLAISKGTDWGWTSPMTIIFASAAILVIGAWSVHQGHRPYPLVNLRSAAIPQVLLTNVASVLIGFTMYAVNLIVPPVIQLPVELGYGLGQSMLAMGLWMMPMGMGMLAVTNIGPAMSRARTPRFTLITSGLVTAASYGIILTTLATIGNRTQGTADQGRIVITLILLSLASLLMGAGIALALGAMPALVLESVPITETAAANGLNSLARSLGTSTSAAVLGVLLASFVSRSGVPSLSGYLIALGLTLTIALAATGVAAAIPRARVR